jgi:WD40 repeat protein
MSRRADTSATWSGDGGWLCSGRPWRANAFIPLRALGAVVAPGDHRPRAIAVLDPRVVVACPDTVIVYDTARGEEAHRWTGHLHPAVAVLPGPGGADLVTAARFGELVRWALDGTRLASIDLARPVLRAARSADGRRLAVAGLGATVDLLDAHTFARLGTVAAAGEVLDVALSPDGSRLATALADRTVRIWETASGREVLALHGHAHPVRCVAWSDDGEDVASGDGAREDLSSAVRVWGAAR